MTRKWIPAFAGMTPAKEMRGQAILIDFSAAPSTALRAKGLFEMTVGSGRFQRLQVSFYVETRYYNSIFGVLYHKLRDFSRGFLREKTAKTGIDLNEQAW